MCNIIDYIAKEGLVVGQEYWCKARNFTIGKWNGEAFEYMREKWGGRYTDTEYHWDDGPPYGTVKPLSRWGDCDFDEERIDIIGQNGNTGEHYGD